MIQILCCVDYAPSNKPNYHGRLAVSELRSSVASLHVMFTVLGLRPKAWGLELKFMESQKAALTLPKV